MKNIHDFLKSFAEVNSQKYVENEYVFVRLTDSSKEWHQEALDVFEKYKAEHYKYFVKLNNWKNELLSECENYWIGKIPIDFDLKALVPKEFLIEAIMEELKEEPQEVIKAKDDFGYEFNRVVSSEDYFFETTKGVYWLSFSVYD
ncbi:hypothetical protein HPT25_26170 [Bacillus sp. BRMEA1]|uniref:hypothetical protein n=1 Tax=Neobacillus endophyticus TaxID=2738405 RepID=UPI001565311E|nr:hypothetical protein [Neobacillus endophyticus]NRD80817.1 hypothetical protein [Neobacillus endophyticus]